MILILLLLLLSLGYAWLQFPMKNWMITCCLVFLVALVSGLTNTVLTLLIFLILASLTSILFFFPDFRKQQISARVLKYVKKSLPPISRTEREAIEAGTVWWDAELFSGTPNWDVLLKSDPPTLSTEEDRYIQETVSTLCEMSDDWQITQELNDLPDDVWQYIKNNGFFGLNASKEYGGLGLSAHAQSTILQMLSTRSTTTAVTVMVPNSLGPAELIYHYGTQEQKDYYLPRLAEGRETPCFGLTNPWAGSDAGGMPDYGVVCEKEIDGEIKLGFSVTWEKRYITLGPVATLLGLAFKAYDPDKLLGNETEPGITCALVPTNTPGVEMGKRHLPLNASFQNGPNSGVQVFIPIDWVIGGEPMVGQGWRMLMESLSAGRGISLPAAAAGTAKLALRTTSAYVRIREQFGIEIGEFEGVQEALARMAGLTYLLDSGRSVMTSALADGHKPAIISAIVKQQCTDLSRMVINDAMDIHGGKGICMGPSNYLARIYQQIPIGITVEGANILTRSLIIFGQGAIRCHPYLLKEMEAANLEDEVDAINQFDNALVEHIKHTISNKVRAFGFGLTRGWLARGTGQGAALRYSRIIEHLSASLAFVADISLLLLGGDLKRKEMLSGRFADVLSNLYLASSAIKVFRDNGSTKREGCLLDWACQYALYRAQGALDEVLRNFPVRWLGIGLRIIVFPSGCYLKMPSDRLNLNVSRLIQSNCPARDRLTREVYIPRDDDEIVSSIEKAYTLCEKTRDLRKRIRKEGHDQNAGESYTDWLSRLKTKTVISPEDASILLDTRKAVDSVIQVDSFWLASAQKRG